MFQISYGDVLRDVRPYFEIPEFRETLFLKKEESPSFGNFYDETSIKVFPFGETSIKWPYPSHIEFSYSPISKNLMIDSISVEPHFQGEGHGRRLVNCTENFAESRGIQMILLNSENDFFWEKLGYAKNLNPPYFSKNLTI